MLETLIKHISKSHLTLCLLKVENIGVNLEITSLSAAYRKSFCFLRCLWVSFLCPFYGACSVQSQRWQFPRLQPLPARHPAPERACGIVDVTTGFSVESKLPRLHKTTPHHRYLLPLSFLVSTEQLSTACVGPEVFCNCTMFLPPEAAARDNTGMRVFQAATCPSLQRRGTSSSLLGVWNLQDARRYSSLEKSFCLLCYFTTGNP